MANRREYAETEVDHVWYNTITSIVTQYERLQRLSFDTETAYAMVSGSWIYPYRNEPKFISTLRKALGGKRRLYARIKQDHLEVKDLMMLIAKARAETLKLVELQRFSSIDELKKETSHVQMVDVAEVKIAQAPKVVKSCEVQSCSLIPCVKEKEFSEKWRKNVPEDMVLRIFQGIQKPFEVVIYAPPASGKTTAFSTFHVLDTDKYTKWRSHAPVLITNVPTLHVLGKVSIAIVPDESVFVTRCCRRHILNKGQADIGHKWYCDMLGQLEFYSVAYHTNSYVHFALKTLLNGIGRKRLRVPGINYSCLETSRVCLGIQSLIT